MPLLFALGIHNSLCEISADLLPGEHLFAYLDDIYVIAEPERIPILLEKVEQQSLLKDDDPIRTQP